VKRSGFFLLMVLAAIAAGADNPAQPNQLVGEVAPEVYATPVNQMLTPAGAQVELPGLRPQALALSPDGRWLAVSGKTPELLLIPIPLAGKVQRVPFSAAPAEDAALTNAAPLILDPDRHGQLSFTGLIFSPDGSRIYLSSVAGFIKVFKVDASGAASPLPTLPLPPANAPRREKEIPAGLALSADGKILYVALNLSNRLAEMDAATGRLLRLWDVGVAPYDVVLTARKAYVSNWGGRRPKKGDLTGPAGRGTVVRVDPVRHIASEGSVSVIDLASGRLVTEILTGLHASAMALSPDGKYVVVANAGSDTLSAIDTRKDEIVETIWARQGPADLFGAGPNALTFDPSGDKLYVCNGTQNAVAAFDFAPGHSKLLGLVPVGWFPGALVFDRKRNAVYVANIKGTGAAKRSEAGGAKFNSKQYCGTLSLFPVPSKSQLAEHTRIALRNLRYPLLAAARFPPRPGQPPLPVPERVGEPSHFKHVVYLIKENRTYDQVLGDVKSGKGEPSLCIFGEEITPNQHKMVRDFVLLDNTYCSGILSADGHQWATSAFATDYMEKSFAGFPRSYPHGMDEGGVDALVYSPAGFIWDNAVAHGRTIRDYGEFAMTEKSWIEKTKRRGMSFSDHWKDFTNPEPPAIRLWSKPSIESLRPYLCTNTVGWDLSVPDVFRARQFVRELREFEKTGGFPNLSIICLPNDHTSGTKAGGPTPAAMVADNDLAFGQIVEALSHSRFWPETCIFAIEDDPQAGWDHISGYRTTAYVISPYTKRGQVISTQYNQTSLLRTIELILGLPPMNQMDATATPMSDCFTATADLTPFTAVTNRVPLDQVNPAPKKISDPLLRHYARLSEKLPLALPDQCPEDELNRILWHSAKGSQIPYPVWAVNAVDDD
jgi:YVTN family beta-propeller protein